MRRQPDSAAGSAPSGDSGGVTVAPPRLARAHRWVMLIGRPVIAVAAIVLVWRELASLDIGAMRLAMRRADPAWLAGAAVAAILTVCVMGLYDVVAFKGSSLPPWRRWRVGALVLAQTNLLTLGPIGGPAIRFYLYRRAGIETREFLAGLAMLYIGIYSGLVAWLGASFLPLGESAAALAGRIGAALLFAPVLALIGGALLRLIRADLAEGRTRSLLKVGLIGFLDWLGMLACFALAARSIGLDATLHEQARALFLGQAAGFLSMLPGGLGAADAVWLEMLGRTGAQTSSIAAQIVLFRAAFYLTPWVVSLIALSALVSHRTFGGGRE